MGKRRWWAGLAAAAVVLATAAPASSAPDDPIADPIPQDPIQSRLGLVLAEVAQLPESTPTPPTTDHRLVRHNRINFVGEVPDRSGRLYVPDLNGPLYLLDGGTPHLYLDLVSRFPNFWAARGMGSGFGFVAFHPEFARNGKLYTTHTEGKGAIDTETPTYPNQPNAVVQSVVTEWTADDPSADVFTGSRRELFRYGFGTTTHAVQQIDFNPNARRGDPDHGLLYLAVGDGGLGVSSDVPQDLGNPAGKILRIDPLGTNGPGGRYGIPRANPFVGRPGALGEIYAYGMRDPHRFTWDRGGSHAMYLGHIGQHAIEAVYEVRAGDNLGWSRREGAFTFRREDQCRLYPLPADDARYGYVYPVAAYDHDPPAGWSCSSDSGHAISGGQVYRGRAVPQLRGKYVFGDLVDGRVFYTEVSQMRRGKPMAPLHELQLFDTDGNVKRMTNFVGDGRVDLRFGTDAAGELYLLTKADGRLWKVVGTRTGPRTEVTQAVARDLVAHYDFDHPFPVDDAREIDLGESRTLFRLINGGEEMRVDDSAFPGSNNALVLRPSPGENDDWKAGVWDEDGAESLRAFNGAKGITIMGWFKMTGENPSPGYGAVGLAGLLSGNSDGHSVRALIEAFEVNGEMRLVALGRRIDGGASQTYAAEMDWREALPQDRWVHLAATFDYTTGQMALYRDGKPLPGFYAVPGDPWQVDGTGTSPTDPRGIKVGGSFPQDTAERNPCTCRMDSLMFLDVATSADVVAEQYRRFTRR
ncbi:PQQ-dependent sugar dehydrogenase [Saccharothrix deserti]|uniref:PQQ-dependent sugar dehydrogenase n=1 Tax=Saccharothrix deserti TaxID=2593674 RepID=UPI00131C62D6|nr:PQQ-dependent sugar dehydrogenase [Saccharothrix deserti]